MSRSLQARSLTGFLWAFGENAGVAALSLASFVAMARLLDPADFGVVALASVFVVCFNLVVGSTLADGLVQRNVIGREHCDTAFWGTVALGAGLAFVCIFAARPIASILGEPGIAKVLPWLAAVPLAGAFGAVPTALQRRRLSFRLMALCNLTGRITGAVIGVIMAVGDFGVWSLVGQQVATAVVANAGILLISRWRPGMQLSLRCLKDLSGFGAHVSASQVVSVAGEQMIVLVVGVMFGSTMLGHFTVAWRMVQLIKALVAGTVYHVAFSAFSRLQDDRPALTRAFLGATQISCLVGFPLALGLAAVAEPAVLGLFGDRWSASVDLFAILALETAPAFYVLFFSSCYRALGRPGWTLGLAIAYFLLGLAATAAVAPFGLHAIAVAWLAKSIALLPVNLLLMGRLLAVEIRSLLAPAFGPFAAAALMGLSTKIILAYALFTMTAIEQLAVATTFGALIYGLGLLAFARRPAIAALRMLATVRGRQSAAVTEGDATAR